MCSNPLSHYPVSLLGHHLDCLDKVLLPTPILVIPPIIMTQVSGVLVHMCTESFPYLGSKVGQNGKGEKEVAVRLEKAGIRKVFKSHNLSEDTKLYTCLPNLSDACLTVWCEAWNVSNQDLRELKTFQMRSMSP